MTRPISAPVVVLAIEACFVASGRFPFAEGLPNSELGIERCRLSYFATKSREIMSTRTVGVGRLRHMGRIGKRYDEIASTDPSYLQWIVETSEMEEGIEHSARHWLAHVARDSR